jgi:hypothetical protein
MTIKIIFNNQPQDKIQTIRNKIKIQAYQLRT